MRESTTNPTLSRTHRSRRALVATVGMAVAIGLTVGTAAEAGASTPARRAGAAPSSGTLSAQAAAPVVGPSGDAFYVPPSPLTAGAPGDVIWYRKAEATSPLGDLNLNDVDAWQVLYRSTDAAGRPDAVSGMVLLPKGRLPGTLPVVGFGPGTHGLGDDCAPSKWIRDGIEYESLAIGGILDRGWAVALTDYQGLGTPGTHPYMIGRSQGAALLDVVRAARRLPAAQLSAAAPVALYGYSQGGGASGWAAEMQPSYAPELPLRGVVAGGVPADLAVVAKNLDGGVGFAFLAMSSVGLDATYPELKLNAYLNPAGIAAMAEANQICLFQALPQYAFDKIADYTTSNPLDTPAWKARVDQQRLGRQAPKVPVFLAHGLQDEFIPYQQAAQLRRDWCSAGVKVTWQDFIGEHMSTMAAMQNDAMDFLADRFAGKPVRSSC
jgi:hypothetical protein